MNLLDAAWMPIVLGLCSSFLFGLSAMVVQLALTYAGSRTGSLYSIGSSVGMFLLLLPLFANEVPWTWDMLLWFVGFFTMIGIFTPGVSLVLAFEGNRLLGPTISSTVASTAPVFAVLAAVAVLGERPPAEALIGTAAVVAGIMALSWRGGAGRNWAVWALLFPLGAAALRGTVHMGTRFGLSQVAAPMMSALVVFAAAFVAGVMREGMLNRANFRRLPLRGGLLFVLTGVLNGGGVIAMNMGLMVGQVSIVSPIVSSFPVFTCLFSMLLGVERLSKRVILGMLLVVAGVAAISAR